jgi:hypothetical protein
MLGGIDAVDRDAVHAMCRKLFSRPKLALAVLGRTSRFRLRDPELQL